MVKTTINLEDELYKKLVKEAVERYGRARSFSRLVNEKLRMSESVKTGKEISKKISIVDKTFGAWGRGPSGKEFVRKLRKESDERFKRLGL